jgi:hypothetical protein
MIKPTEVIMVPIVVGLRFPNLDTTKPDATENTNDYTILPYYIPLECIRILRISLLYSSCRYIHSKDDR